MFDDEERIRILPDFGDKKVTMIAYGTKYVELPPEMAKVLTKELETKRKDEEHEHYELHHLKEGVDAILWTLSALYPEMFGTEKAVEELYQWKPDQYTPNSSFKKSGYYSKGDEDAPFLSESFLYNLLGKSDARSLLGMLNRALGSRGRK